MKAYLLVFNDSLLPAVSRQIMIDFLETRRSEVPNWYACFNQAILLNSEHSASNLSDLIRERFPNIWFVISEINPTTVNGWAPKQFWDFVNNPRRAGT